MFFKFRFSETNQTDSHLPLIVIMNRHNTISLNKHNEITLTNLLASFRERCNLTSGCVWLLLLQTQHMVAVDVGVCVGHTWLPRMFTFCTACLQTTNLPGGAIYWGRRSIPKDPIAPLDQTFLHYRFLGLTQGF